MDKSAIGAIILIVIMLGSTFTMGLLQAFSFGATGSAVKKQELPKSSIIDYELAPEVKETLLQRGVTIVRFSYGLSCEGCLEAKNYLEGLVQKESSQMVLSEVVSNATTPGLTVSSYFGEQSVHNLAQEEIFKTVCDLMVQPPVECAKFKI